MNFLKNKKIKLNKKDIFKIEIHSHTVYSRDSTISIEKFRKECLKKRIIPCITDHDTIKGAKEYKKKYGEKSCIVGEEIRTKQGEVIGLYLNKEIKPYLDFYETLKELKKQDAIIIIPHPFDRLRKSVLQKDILENLNNILKKLKINKKNVFIEVYNSRNVFDSDNIKALNYAKKNGFSIVVGSDAHFSFEIGTSYIEIPKNLYNEFIVSKTKNKEKEIFINILKNGKFVKKKSKLFIHVLTKIIKKAKKYFFKN